MQKTLPDRKNHEGSLLWLLKVGAGFLIILLLALHFVVNHLVAPGGLLSYADVVQYYQAPIIPIIEGLFLIFVVTHALLGVRSIVLDLNPPQKIIRWLDVLFVLLGLFASAYGIWLLVVVAGRSM